MAIPVAPQESAGAGEKILFILYDNAGTNAPAIFSARKHRTLNTTEVAELDVYPTSGDTFTGYKETTSGSEVAIVASSIPCQGVIVKASPDNVGDIWVGKTGLTINKSSTDGYRLAPGESVGVPTRNANAVFIRASATGYGVYWIASAD